MTKMTKEQLDALIEFILAAARAEAYYVSNERDISTFREEQALRAAFGAGNDE